MSDRNEGEAVPLALTAGGALTLVLGWILGSGTLRALGLTAAVVGGGLYARGRLPERSETIDEAESHIRSELDELDPIARAQVLEGLARSEP